MSQSFFFKFSIKTLWRPGKPQYFFFFDFIFYVKFLLTFFQVLKKSGAIGLHVLATHGLFSGDSIQTIRTHVNFIKKIVVTNTIPQKRNQEELKDILCVQDVSGK